MADTKTLFEKMDEAAQTVTTPSTASFLQKKDSEVSSEEKEMEQERAANVKAFTNTEAKVDNNLTLSAPWYTFAKTVKYIFEKDPDITVAFSDEINGTLTITIETSSPKKLISIKKIVGSKRNFGNINVVIKYALTTNAITTEDYQLAFADTGLIDQIIESQDPMGTDFVVVNRDLVQFYNDNIFDYHGNITMTLEEAILSIINMGEQAADIAICTKSE